MGGDRYGGQPQIRPNGTSEFRILEIVDDRALIQSTLQEAPGAHPWSLRLIGLIPVPPD
ncbi:hypothetical protein ACIA5E_18615 [Nocardia asteroides]|uniref:hypothetical protein n=1 Tax=Nocardia asteroides TaxID=1824 RepID=UPI003790112E